MRYRKALWVGAAVLAVAVGGSLISPRPAQAVAREIIELQSDVQLLLQGQRDIQNSMAQNQGVLKTLAQQSDSTINNLGTTVNDSVNKMNTSFSAFQKSMLDFRANSAARSDTMSTRLQALSDKLDALGGRLAQLNQQLVDLQNSVQSLNAEYATNPPAVSARASAAPSHTYANSPSPSSPDVLYSTGYRDFIGGNYNLAKQEFQQYVQSFPNSELASDAQFFIGEIDYAQKNYGEAVAAYDKVLQDYPNSFKGTAARLKKVWRLSHSVRSELALTNSAKSSSIIREPTKQDLPAHSFNSWACPRRPHLLNHHPGSRVPSG